MQNGSFFDETKRSRAGRRSKISVYLFAVYRERVNRYESDYV